MIISLLHYLQVYNPVMRYLMPTQQATEIAREALQAPLNTLVAIVAILCIILAIGILVTVFKLAPIILQQIQQLIDNNTKLTKIVEDGEKRSEQRTTALSELGKKTDKQTETLTAIGDKTDHQTEVLEAVGKTFSDHHIATAETVANLSDKVESLERSVDDLKRIVGGLDTTIKGITNCDKMIDQLEKWKSEVITEIKEQAKHATDSQPIVVIQPPANVIPDSGAGEAAA